VVLIAGANALLGLGEAAAGQTAIIVATISSAVGAIYSRRFDAVAPQVTAAGALTCAAMVLGPLCVFVEAPLKSAPSAAAIAALLANAVLATALGFVVYFRLIRTIGSMGAASVSYLKPAAGVLIGCTLLGETLTWTAALGLIAILTGVAAINPNSGRMQRTSTGVAEKSAQEATHV
jgi:drug/metabolite transporter (DMT)-like permease